MELLRLPEVMAMTKLSKATIYRAMRRGFPKPIRLSQVAVAWRKDEVESYLNDRPRGGSGG